MVLVAVHDPDVFPQEPGNREWCSSIECIGLHWAVPPFIIFKLKRSISTRMFKSSKLQRIGNFVSVLRVGAIQNLHICGFNTMRNTQDQKNHSEQWRLLLCDGDSSHHSADFVAYCLDHKIACFHIPPHSSHATQPLDVGCFGPLEHYYSEAVTKACATGLANISKQQFVQYYSEAQRKAFTKENQQAAFCATGVHPWCPDKVIEQCQKRAIPEPMLSNTNNPYNTQKTDTSLKNL